jgi:hypothetical protein
MSPDAAKYWFSFTADSCNNCWRNCISEYSKIKKCIPKDYLRFLKNENNDIE